MKTYKQFQEAAFAIPAAAGVISKVLPAAATIIGAAGTINQIKKNEKFGKQTKKGLKNIAKNIDKNKLEPDTAAEREELIAKSKPEVGKLVDKQVKSDKGMDKLLDKINSAQKPKRKYRTRLNPGVRNNKRVMSDAEKKIFDKSQKDTDQKVNTDVTPREKVVNNILDRRKKDRQERNKRPNRIQSDRRRIRRGLEKGEIMLDQFTPTNNVGGGQIAGTAEAGDDPPVKKKKKKKKKYIYGGRGSRKMWMNNK